MKKLFLFTAALAASSALAFASLGSGSNAPEGCCVDCICPDFVCSLLGCDSSDVGACCELGECCETGCCITGCCEAE